MGILTKPITAPACNLSKAEIAELARKFADAVNYESGDELPPIVGQLGGKIKILSDLDSLEKSGAIKVFGKDHFEIYLSGFTGAARDRFTIAHELGHYVLHSNLGKRPIWVERSSENVRSEWEANWFAAEFLMPENEFRLRRHKNDSVLASRFGVSLNAIQVRRESLGW